MRMQVRFGILAVCLVTGIGTTNSTKLSGEDRKAPITIRADEIGRTVKVLGRLGCPLYEMMVVRGTWVETEFRSKPGLNPQFRVSQVNGNQLEKPVNFLPYDTIVEEKLGVEVAPATGEQWELRAYETWTIRGHPLEYWEALGVGPRAPLTHDATRMFGVLKKRTAK